MKQMNVFRNCRWLILLLIGCEAPGTAVLSKEPRRASTGELITQLDLNKFPLPADAEIMQRRATHLTAQMPGQVQAATQSLLKTLAAAGFAQGGDAQATRITDEYAQVSLLGKNGVRLSLTVSPLGDGKVMLQLLNQGVCDVGTLPKPDDASPSFSSPTLAMYLSPKPVAAVAAEVAQLLTAAGWQEYAPLDTQRADLPDMRQMTFRQGGHDLNVSVSTAPAQGNKTAINYHVLALSHELPVPVDASGVEFDDAKGELECTVPRPLAEVAADVSKLFAAAGLKETPGEKPTDERIALRFEASNGDVVMATLKNDEGKQTAIRMFTVPAAVIKKLREREGN